MALWDHSLVILAGAETTAADWWQVAIAASALVVTSVLAFLAYRTSNKATTIAGESKQVSEAAAATARSAAETERTAYEFEQARAQRLERLELVADLLTLHNKVQLLKDGTGESTWWWDLDAKLAVACEIHGWTEIGELWAFGKDRYTRTNVAREPEFRFQFKTLAFRWAYDPALAPEITTWISEERAARGWDD